MIAPDFDLPATDGTRRTLAGTRGPRGLLVIFMCNHCPYVRAVLSRIVRDTRELAGYGIGSVAINSNDTTTYPDDGFEYMVELAQQWRFPFPYLYDDTQQVARAYDAVCTPEFFGFDAQMRLCYRGRLDASRKVAADDAPRELFEAMKTIAQTGAGPAVQYPSLGCSIKWREVVAG